MGFLKKASKVAALKERQVKQGIDALLDMTSSQNMMIAKGMYDARTQANMCTATNLLDKARPALERDMRAHYDKQIEKIRADMTQQANEQVEQYRKEAYEHYKKECEAYEDKCRREYDERVKIPKAQLKHEVIGDFLTMVLWVLQDKMNNGQEDLHTFLHEFMRLSSDMTEPRLGLTINDLVQQMKTEGYDLKGDINLVNELVEAEQERYNDLFGKPYIPRGSIKDKWREGEDKRMKRLLIGGVDYSTVGIILGRSEGACKARAKKLWGSQDIERIREGA